MKDGMTGGLLLGKSLCKSQISVQSVDANVELGAHGALARAFTPAKSILQSPSTLRVYTLGRTEVALERGPGPKQVCTGFPTDAGCDSVLRSDSGGGAWLAGLH